jgi:hypothetical protein
LEKAALKEQEAKEERDRAEDEQKESAKGAVGGEKDISEDAVNALEKDIEQRNERSYVSHP